MRRWIARFLILGCLALAVVLGPLASSTAQAADCKPDGVPNAAGSGTPGLIDDPTTNPSGDTYYGEYGWSGLKWHTCDLGAGPDVTNDPVAILDTYFGNAGMAVATVESSLMTQLHEWAVDPGELLEPVDKVVAEVTEILRRALWNQWAPVVIILAAIVIAWHANTQQVRRSLHTVVAILISCGVVGWIMMGPVKAAQTFDEAVGSVVGGVDRSIVNVTGNADLSDEEARGATFHDEILYRLWCRGALSNDKIGDEYCPKLYEANAVAYEDLDDYDSDDYRDDYNDVANDLEDEDDSYYDALKGKQYNRTGQGFIGIWMMTMIALIRIPAEILMVAGLLVMRLAVMLGPIFALAGILEATRPLAIAAFKMILASVINVAVYGIIAALHTAIVTGIIAGDPGMIVTLVLVTILTILFWKLSKPFRSPTKLATGAEAGEQMTGMGDTSRMTQLMTGLLGAKIGGALATRGGSQDDDDDDDAERPRSSVGDDRDETYTRPDDGPGNQPGAGGPNDGPDSDGPAPSGTPSVGGPNDGAGLDQNLMMPVPDTPEGLFFQVPEPIREGRDPDGPSTPVFEASSADDRDRAAPSDPADTTDTTPDWRPESDLADEEAIGHGPADIDLGREYTSVNIDATQEYGGIDFDMPETGVPNVTVLATGSQMTHEVTLTEPEYTSAGDLSYETYRPDRDEPDATVIPTEEDSR